MCTYKTLLRCPGFFYRVLLAVFLTGLFHQTEVKGFFLNSNPTCYTSTISQSKVKELKLNGCKTLRPFDSVSENLATPKKRGNRPHHALALLSKKDDTEEETDDAWKPSSLLMSKGLGGSSIFLGMSIMGAVITTAFGIRFRETEPDDDQTSRAEWLKDVSTNYPVGPSKTIKSIKSITANDPFFSGRDPETKKLIEDVQKRIEEVVFGLYDDPESQEEKSKYIRKLMYNIDMLEEEIKLSGSRAVGNTIPTPSMRERHKEVFKLLQCVPAGVATNDTIGESAVSLRDESDTTVTKEKPSISGVSLAIKPEKEDDNRVVDQEWKFGLGKNVSLKAANKVLKRNPSQASTVAISPREMNPDIDKAKKEAEKKRLAAIAAEAKRKEEEDKKRLAAITAEKKRKEAEMKTRKELEEKRLSEIAAAKKKRMEAQERRQAEIAAAAKRTKEAEERRIAAQARKKEAEEKRLAEIAAKEEAKKKEEEAEEKRLAEIAAEEKAKKKVLETKRLAEIAAEANKRKEAEEKRIAEISEEVKRKKEAKEKRLAEIAAEAKKKEAEAKRLAEIAAETKRKEEEAEAKRLAEIAAEAKKKEEEAEAKRLAEIAAETKRKEEEAEAKRLAEIAAETKRKEEEAEQKRLAEIAAETKRKEEEAEAKRLAEIAAEAKKKKEEAEEKRLTEIAAEAKRKEEEAEAKRLAEIAAEAKKKEEAEAKLLAEIAAEAKRKEEEERLVEEAMKKEAEAEVAAKAKKKEAEEKRVVEEAKVKGAQNVIDIDEEEAKKRRLVAIAAWEKKKEAEEKRLAEIAAREKEEAERILEEEKNEEVDVAEREHHFASVEDVNEKEDTVGSSSVDLEKNQASSEPNSTGSTSSTANESIEEVITRIGGIVSDLEKGTQEDIEKANYFKRLISDMESMKTSTKAPNMFSQEEDSTETSSLTSAESSTQKEISKGLDPPDILSSSSQSKDSSNTKNEPKRIFIAKPISSDESENNELSLGAGSLRETFPDVQREMVQDQAEGKMDTEERQEVAKEKVDLNPRRGIAKTTLSHDDISKRDDSEQPVESKKPDYGTYSVPSSGYTPRFAPGGFGIPASPSDKPPPSPAVSPSSYTNPSSTGLDTATASTITDSLEFPAPSDDVSDFSEKSSQSTTTTSGPTYSPRFAPGGFGVAASVKDTPPNISNFKDLSSDPSTSSSNSNDSPEEEQEINVRSYLKPPAGYKSRFAPGGIDTSPTTGSAPNVSPFGDYPSMSKNPMASEENIQSPAPSPRAYSSRFTPDGYDKSPSFEDTASNYEELNEYGAFDASPMDESESNAQSHGKSPPGYKSRFAPGGIDTSPTTGSPSNVSPFGDYSGMSKNPMASEENIQSPAPSPRAYSSRFTPDGYDKSPSFEDTASNYEELDEYSAFDASPMDESESNVQSYGKSPPGYKSRFAPEGIDTSPTTGSPSNVSPFGDYSGMSKNPMASEENIQSPAPSPRAYSPRFAPGGFGVSPQTKEKMSDSSTFDSPLIEEFVDDSMNDASETDSQLPSPPRGYSPRFSPGGFDISQNTTDLSSSTPGISDYNFETPPMQAQDNFDNDPSAVSDISSQLPSPSPRYSPRFAPGGFDVSPQTVDSSSYVPTETYSSPEEDITSSSEDQTNYPSSLYQDRVGDSLFGVNSPTVAPRVRRNESFASNTGDIPRNNVPPRQSFKESFREIQDEVNDLISGLKSPSEAQKQRIRHLQDLVSKVEMLEKKNKSTPFQGPKTASTRDPNIYSESSSPLDQTTIPNSSSGTGGAPYDTQFDVSQPSSTPGWSPFSRVNNLDSLISPDTNSANSSPPNMSYASTSSETNTPQSKTEPPNPVAFSSYVENLAPSDSVASYSPKVDPKTWSVTPQISFEPTAGPSGTMSSTSNVPQTSSNVSPSFPQSVYEGSFIPTASPAKPSTGVSPVFPQSAYTKDNSFSPGTSPVVPNTVPAPGVSQILPQNAYASFPTSSKQGQGNKHGVSPVFPQTAYAPSPAPDTSPPANNPEISSNNPSTRERKRGFLSYLDSLRGQKRDTNQDNTE